MLLNGIYKSHPYFLALSIPLGVCILDPLEPQKGYPGTQANLLDQDGHPPLLLLHSLPHLKHERSWYWQLWIA